MTETRHPTLDPAAFEVLREVANQEHSALLRVPTARAGPRSIDIWLAREPISHGAAFLSSAERHLLQVHRDEVASWMRLAAFQGLFEDPEKSGLMARELDAKSLIELPGRPALRDQAHDLLRAADPRHLPPEAAPLLRRATARRAPRPQNPWTLAALSLRLVPHPVPQQWFAFRELGSSHLSHVRAVLAETHDRVRRQIGQSPIERGNLELAGAFAAAEARWDDAARLYEVAACGEGGGKLTAFWWLLNAAQAGQAERVFAASNHLSSLGAWSKDLFRAATTAMTVSRESNNWKPTDAAPRLIESLEGPHVDWIRPWLR